MITSNEARTAWNRITSEGWYAGCPFEVCVQELCQDRIMGPTRARVRLSVQKLRNLWGWRFSKLMSFMYPHF